MSAPEKETSVEFITPEIKPVDSTLSAPQHNAFTMLMSSKPPSPPKTKGKLKLTSTNPDPFKGPFTGKDGLGAYIVSPEAHPPSHIIHHNASFVVINDNYPKSSLHMLILPRDPSKTFLHPIDALSTDDQFLDSVKQEVAKVKALGASELRRRYGKQSKSEQARNEALDADPAPETLPPGRYWEKSMMAGIHAGPSMNHLHIHVLSVDRENVWMKHRKHYNSFNTPFFVPMEDFPLAVDDPRRHPGREDYLGWDFRCWRCGAWYGNKFAKLKGHLSEEFKAWREE